jgi:Flp pilus assembly protein TadG
LAYISQAFSRIESAAPGVILPSGRPIMNSLRSRAHSRRGFTLMTTALSAAGMVGMLGLTVDIGRMYITKNEAQTYADSAALAAVVELDGTNAGLDRARQAVTDNLNRVNLGSQGLANSVVEFADSAAGPWTANPLSAVNHRFVRVTASTPVPLLFLPAVVPTDSATVRSSAAGGQVQRDSFPDGTFPFSPFAHNDIAPDFGLTPGEKHTLRWPSNPKVNVNVCSGDNSDFMIDLAEAGGGEERGYIDETSSSVIREAIVNDYQTTPRTIGDAVAMTGGAKQTQLDSLIQRVNQDTDTTSLSFETYRGNGRRIVGAPINSGQPGGYRIVGFGAFLILPASEYSSGGNKPFCAVYVGPWVQGSKHKGAGSSGAYVARLVQ